MNLLHISRRNLVDRPWSSFLSVLLIALGTGLVSLILLLDRRLDEQLQRNVAGIDLVVGAKGSPLQLMLSAVYQLDPPTGNVSLHELEEALAHPLVETWVPLAYGDNYRGWRIVGSTPEYLDLYGAGLAEGITWSEPLDVVIGDEVARRGGIALGDRFEGVHGLAAAGSAHEGTSYRVVGVLAPNKTVVDRLIVTGLESVWAVHDAGHEHDGDEAHAHEPDTLQQASAVGEAPDRSVTAALVRYRNPMGNVMLPRRVNETGSLQAASPAIELDRLRRLLGFGLDTLKGVALVVMIVGGLSVFITLYAALLERRYEIALLRSMGLSRFRVFALVLIEGLMLALTGFAIGALLGRAGMLISGLSEREVFRPDWALLSPHSGEFLLFAAVIGICSLAALLPAISALRIDIARTLSDRR